MNGDIFIAVCTLGTVRAEWAVGLASMHQPMGRVQQLSLIRNMSIRDARNFAVALADSMECDYLLFWDDDMIPRKTDASQRLINVLDQHDEIDVVGAVYPVRRAISSPCVSEREGGGPFWGWRDGQLHEVFMTGTGFMAIRLSALKRGVAEPYQVEHTTLGKYFWMEEDGKGGITTDDYWFAGWCRHWGIKQYVLGDVLCDQIEDSGDMVRIESAEVLVA
jgi:glycosyltransferase involved in cell wall biosynthesis